MLWDDDRPRTRGRVIAGWTFAAVTSLALWAVIIVALIAAAELIGRWG